MNNKLDLLFRQRPMMKDWYNSKKSLAEYSKSVLSDINCFESEGILSSAITRKAGEILKDRINTGLLNQQLRSVPLISTADHHGLLHYKLLYNSNIILSEVMRFCSMPYSVVLSTGNIPLNNQSYPRGFYFKNAKFNFFPAKYGEQPVGLFTNKIKHTRFNEIIVSYDKNIELSKEEISFLYYLFDHLLPEDSVYNLCSTFSEQITLLNFDLWKFFFDENIRDSIPGLIYLETTSLVREIMINELQKESSLLSLILLDKQTRDIFIEEFHNINGCWGDEFGSYFFWGVSDNKKLQRLEVMDNALSGKDIIIEMTAENIINAIRTKTIFPTLFLSFYIVTFLEDITCFGGFNQIEYLTHMKQAYIRVFERIDRPEMVQRLRRKKTDALICGMIPLQYNSSIDMLWHFNSKNGIFNGNLKGGLTNRDLFSVNSQSIGNMVRGGVESMLENIT
ncbi:MAG: hypothetical protein A2015_10970 [Spirochaetes bacterium GWF1_31_7]|nr:MAG: hypothetical protein A2Y30_13105 [Spirochaetes bacterium GWE1_32_154]OHD48379.1 MAG: hypothetical protein A2015_10970 [Spirochaetes bacterium GWF1_31_7]OHD50472.1 MAG: hypothetical protein A2Y29_11150 [Spirochaetes bacterium GWE2_31_10]OHD82660.1 MAG: hypothetical protein A2355_15160 [Spirochaetes bacterium RIFOXYB1_FULL_32_8]HBD93231.1 hypothetical protein [Spirochaetia bacterium]